MHTLKLGLFIGIMSIFISGAFAQRGAPVGGGSCRWDLDCANGKCVSGKCQCFVGYVCPNCQTLQQNYAPAFGCPAFQGPPMPAIGNAPCVGDLSCSSHGSCTDSGKCKCYSGYVCPNCQLSINDYASGKRCLKPYPMPPSGGGLCKANKDCYNNGMCSNGKCVCNKDFYCDLCQIRGDNYNPAVGCPKLNSTNTVGGGFCWDQDSCNNAGSCDNNICSCYTGYMCTNCQMAQSDWDKTHTCPEYKMPPSPLSAISGGGSNCTDSSECNGAKNGGFCEDGQCYCNSGFKCGRCSMEQWQLDEVTKCADVGGEPCTSNAHCNFRGVCNKQTKRCECYGGYYCANCKYTSDDIRAGKMCKAMSTKWPTSGALSLCPVTFLIWDLFAMMAIVLLSGDGRSETQTQHLQQNPEPRFYMPDML